MVLVENNSTREQMRRTEEEAAGTGRGTDAESKESVRARLRAINKRTLRKYGSPRTWNSSLWTELWNRPQLIADELRGKEKYLPFRKNRYPIL